MTTTTGGDVEAHIGERMRELVENAMEEAGRDRFHDCEELYTYLRACAPGMSITNEEAAGAVLYVSDRIGERVVANPKAWYADGRGKTVMSLAEGIHAVLKRAEPSIPHPESSDVPVMVKRLPGNDLALPAYQTEHAAGMDLCACIPENEPIELQPMTPVMVPTGIAVAVPEGYELQIRPRSGLAIKHGVTVVNTPGTVDADYRGEVMVGLVLLAPGRTPAEASVSGPGYVVRRGERIAQAVLKRVPRARWVEAVVLPDTARGAGGFGSTGR